MWIPPSEVEHLLVEIWVPRVLATGRWLLINDGSGLYFYSRRLDPQEIAVHHVAHPLVEIRRLTFW